MTDRPAPKPDSAGRRVPPPRVPPGAVGLLTPPPPPRPRGRAVSHPSRLRVRLAQGFVGVAAVGLGSGIAALASSALVVAVGAAVALAGAPLLFASVRSERERVLRLARPSRRRLDRAA